MSLARGFEPKTELTPEQRVKVAYFHLINGWSQHDLAAYEGVNSARVAEAIDAVRKAVEWTKNNG